MCIRDRPRNVDEAFGQGQSKQALDPEPTAQLVRHVIGEQEQDGTHGDPREGRHLGKQGPQRRKQQDGDSQKMQDTDVYKRQVPARGTGGR